VEPSGGVILVTPAALAGPTLTASSTRPRQNPIVAVVLR